LLKIFVCPTVLNYQIFAIDEASVVQALQDRYSLLGASFCVVLLRSPITGVADCCARAQSGHAAAPPTTATKPRRR
jgi:hypothetical protein